jgi:hypothetical protein
LKAIVGGQDDISSSNRGKARRDVKGFTVEKGQYQKTFSAVNKASKADRRGDKMVDARKVIPMNEDEFREF